LVRVFYFYTMIDYLIVGSGLAGICFAETALKNQKSIYVVNDNSQQSSVIAAGLYNPVILKRFSALQDAMAQIELLQPFYAALERKLDCKLDYKMPILRKFFSVEEQNDWYIAADKPGLVDFLSTKIINTTYNGIASPFDFGEVLHTGYVDTAVLLQKYRTFLKHNDWIEEARFDYENVVVSEHNIIYKNLIAKHIVFAEGFGMNANPFFNHLPLDGTKGELLVIKAPHLELDVIINTSLFILPLGDDLFKIGATYNWYDKTQIPTDVGKQELVDKIKSILNCDFEIIEHLAGVRPTVKDRKPLLGTHPNYQNVHILNGLGTRGVMLGPYMAKMLFENIESGVPLDISIDISRFNKQSKVIDNVNFQ
jgi:glycine oxidase